jgi:hypothetical protein
VTSAQVDQARRTLAARGEPITARAVNRLLRQTPPRFMGGSFSDLLRLLKIPAVPSETEQTIQTLNELTAACEAAAPPELPKLLQTIDATWVRCMQVMLRASARGDDTVALTAAFERLREARAAAIIRKARR